MCDPIIVLMKNRWSSLLGCKAIFFFSMWISLLESAYIGMWDIVTICKCCSQKKKRLNYLFKCDRISFLAFEHYKRFFKIIFFFIDKRKNDRYATILKLRLSNWTIFSSIPILGLSKPIDFSLCLDCIPHLWYSFTNDFNFRWNTVKFDSKWWGFFLVKSATWLAHYFLKIWPFNRSFGVVLATSC